MLRWGFNGPCSVSFDDIKHIAFAYNLHTLITEPEYRIHDDIKIVIFALLEIIRLKCGNNKVYMTDTNPTRIYMKLSK